MEQNPQSSAESALDKIRRLKEEREVERLAGEKAQQEREQAEEQARQEKEQAEKQAVQVNLKQVEQFIVGLEKEKQDLETQLQEKKVAFESTIDNIRGAVSEAQDGEENVLAELGKEERDEIFGDDAEKLTQFDAQKKEIEGKIAGIDTQLENLAVQKQELYEQTPEGQAEMKEKEEKEKQIKLHEIATGLGVSPARPFDGKIENLLKTNNIQLSPEKFSESVQIHGRDQIKEALLSFQSEDVEKYFEKQKEPIVQAQEKIKRISQEAFHSAQEKYKEYVSLQEAFRQMLQEKNSEAELKGLEFDEKFVPGGYKYEDLINVMRYDEQRTRLHDLLVRGQGGGFRMDYVDTEKTLEKKIEFIKTFSEIVKKAKDSIEVAELLSGEGVEHVSTDLYNQYYDSTINSVPEFSGVNKEILDLARIKYPHNWDDQKKYASKFEALEKENNYSALENALREEMKTIESQEYDAVSLVEVQVEKSLLWTEAKQLGSSDIGTLQREKENLERQKNNAEVAIYASTSLGARMVEQADKRVIFDGGFQFEGMKSYAQEQRTQRETNLSEKREALKKSKSELADKEKKPPILLGKEKHAREVAELKEQVKKLEQEVQELENKKDVSQDQIYPQIQSFFEKIGGSEYSRESEMKSFVEKNKDALARGVTLNELLDMMKQDAEEKANAKFPEEKQRILDSWDSATEKQKEIAEKYKS